MSGKNNKKNVANQATETKKVQTKYDLKMQRRKEEAERLKKEAKKDKIIGILVAVLLVAFIASFPIRSMIAVNSTYITVGDEKITQVEFDYNYALAKVSYLNQMGNYLSMFGMDLATIDSQMYDDTLTFADYFDELAAQKIADTKALAKAAKAAGFHYDTEEEYKQTIADIKAAAEAEEVTYKQYMQAVYGPLATEGRLKGIIEETLYAAAYYKEVADSKLPTDEEITAYYEKDSSEYDVLDYHMTIVKAELPTTAPDGTVPKDENGNEVAYEPTEEEVAAAMAEAKKKAEEAEKTVAKDGEAQIGMSKLYVNALLTDFMYAEDRKPGDTYVAEDVNYNRYLVVSFDKRYLDQTPTANARIITSTTEDSAVLLSEWQNGAATEESFIEMVKKYDEGGSIDGLYEGVSVKEISEEMDAWLTDEARKAGDTFAINVEGGSNYVLYYLGENDPEWKINIRNTLLNETMNTYLEELAAEFPVADPKGNLKYLQADATEESSTESSESAAE